MTKEIKLKRIKVRQGKTGFYTSILESGQVALIPADQEATKDGWFDDVPNDTPLDIGAAFVGRKETDEPVEQYGNGSGPVHRNEGTTDEEINLSDPGENPAKVVAAKDDEDGKDAASKETTKADIIAELESLGVQDFNRSARKDELQARLDLVKDALNSTGE